MAATGQRREITTGALSPSGSPAYRSAVDALGPLVWRESEATSS
jgi:hypothetical protein